MKMVVTVFWRQMRVISFPIVVQAIAGSTVDLDELDVEINSTTNNNLNN